MDVFARAMKSIGSQNMLGWFIITIIIALFILGIVLTILMKKYYMDLYTDLKDNANGIDEVDFDNPELENIVNRFKKSTVSGTDNINTEVIIEKNLKSRYIKNEKLIKIIPSILIALGLLGTFLGLTVAIFDTRVALNGVKDVANFTKELQNPIASMSSAFWTSIFGVIASLIMNYFNQSVKYQKEKFYNEIEDYLDNEIFAEHAKTFTTVFEEFSKTVKLTMLTLTEEMTNLFKNGVEELVSKINTSSIDLTESANGLKEYTKEFKSLVETFDNTVQSFEKPVKSFNESISEFVITSDNLTQSVEEGFRNFVDSSESLDKSMIVLSDNIDSSFESMSRAMDITLNNLSANLGQCFTSVLVKFEDSMSDISDEITVGLSKVSNAMNKNEESILLASNSIKMESESIIENQKNIKYLIEKIEENNKIQNKESVYQISMLNKHSSMVDKSFRSFGEVVDNLPPMLAQKFSVVLKEYLDDVGISISKHLEKDMGKVASDIREAAETLDETMKVIDGASNTIDTTHQRRSTVRGRR